MNDSTRILTGAVCACLLAAGATMAAQEGVIRACAGPQGSLRIIGPSDSCRPGETPTEWSIRGPQGPAGEKGDQGQPGETGPEGPQGPAGSSGGTCTAPPPQVIGDITIDGVNTTPVAIYGFSAGATNAGGTVVGGGGAGAGKVTFQDIAITKTTDATSPTLFLRTAEGRHIERVTINLFAPDGTTQITYRLEDVIITAFANAHTANAGAMESVTLNFSKIRFGAAGGPEVVWDVKLNTKL